MINIKRESDNKTEIHNRFLSECMEKISLGDEKAFEQLYNLTKSAVYGYALSILHNHQDAEDVMHDTYVKIYTSASTYEDNQKAMGWILTITRNFAFMKIRSGKKETEIDESMLETLEIKQSGLSSEEKIVLTTALGCISSQELEMIVLHAIWGFKHKEIAKIMNIPLATILSKYSRALKKLRTILDERMISNE